MANRFDNRSRSEFEKDIFDYTQREAYLFSLYLNELRWLGLSPTFSNNGVDNSGKFVERPTKAADYKIVVDDQDTLLEVKISPVRNKFTFKISDLSSYLEQDASILLFIPSEGRVGRSVESVRKIAHLLLFDIVRPDTIRRILEDNKPFAFPPMGNKMVVQVLEKDFGKYCQFKRLRHLRG